MNASPNPLANRPHPGGPRGRPRSRPRYGVVLRRLVGGTILLSGSLIFATDIAWSAAASFDHLAATPHAGIATK